MTDHTIEAHFVVDSGAGIGPQPTLEDRVVAHMVQALGGPDHGNLNAVVLDRQARFLYRAVTAMREALAKETGE